jgi:hypothetical protein
MNANPVIGREDKQSAFLARRGRSAFTTGRRWRSCSKDGRGDQQRRFLPISKCSITGDRVAACRREGGFYGYWRRFAVVVVSVKNQAQRWRRILPRNGTLATTTNNYKCYTNISFCENDCRLHKHNPGGLI